MKENDRMRTRVNENVRMRIMKRKLKEECEKMRMSHCGFRSEKVVAGFEVFTWIFIFNLHQHTCGEVAGVRGN